MGKENVQAKNGQLLILLPPLSTIVVIIPYCHYNFENMWNNIKVYIMELTYI